MGDNPLEPKTEAPKAVDALAAVAGVPTPGQVKGTWALVRRHRKLALLLGGLGVTAAAGGYGYKYLSPTPGKANAQPDTPAVAAKAETPATYTPDGEDRTPAVIPVKADVPAPDVPKITDITPPEIKLPPLKPAAPSTDKSDTAPPLVLPPMDEPKKETGPTIPVAPLPDVTASSDIKLPDITAPALPVGPTIPATGDDKKKAGDKKKAEGDDIFKAPEPPPIDPKKVDPTAPPAALPSTVNEKKDKKDPTPVIRVQGVQPATIPDVPKIDAPPAVKKDPALDLPPIPPLDAPPTPGEKKSDPPIIAPPATEKKDHPRVKDNTIPSIDVPTVGSDTKIDPPLPPLGPGPMDVKLPEVKSPVPTINPDPPPVINPITVPPIGPRTDVPTPAAEKKNTYEEDWHTWKTGDTYALISQEYYHDGKFSAALEAYNKEHRKPGDPIVRVPELWKLQDLYPNLIGKAPEKPERVAPSEVKPANNNGIKFEPVAPLPGSGKTAATPTSRTDEYKVTAEAGEMMREVARKSLGNADSWRKISNLNPDLDPTLPIPAGTVVKLPK
jgi:hypothetical protein